MERILVVDFGGQYAHLIANRIRRIGVLADITNQEDFSERFPRLPINSVSGLAETLIRVHGIDAVFYDITNKPPATIEWE